MNIKTVRLTMLVYGKLLNVEVRLAGKQLFDRTILAKTITQKDFDIVDKNLDILFKAGGVNAGMFVE